MRLSEFSRHDMTCKNCRFFVEDDNTCRYNPPVAFAVAGQDREGKAEPIPVTLYPNTEPGNACAFFYKR